MQLNTWDIFATDNLKRVKNIIRWDLDMLISNVEIKNLYGKNYNVPLNNKLIILYGLNGSGKTTILNIIYLVLKGEIRDTLKYNYDYLKIEFLSNKHTKILEVIKIEDTSSYRVLINKEIEHIFENDNHKEIYQRKMNEELEDDIFKVNSYKNKKSSLYKDRLRNESFRDFTEKDRNEIVYVPLDRKVQGVETGLYPGRRIAPSSNRENIKNSLSIAENYFKEYQRYITRRENHIHIQMRSQILRQLSNPVQNWKNNLSLDSANNFDKLIIELKDVIDNNLNENVSRLIEIFNSTFDSYNIVNDEIFIKDSIKFLDHSYALAQLNNLHNVTEKVKPLKKAIDDLKQKSKLVINSVNELLKETEKKIVYDSNEELFYFTNLKKQEQIELKYLSSGEKQLIMFYIFSLIKFDKNSTKLFLIDEPELSLHIDWQTRLLSSIVELNDNTQIILATHSPDIIGNYVENLVEIKGISI